MATTDTLPSPGTAEGRAALEQEARGHGFADARAYTEAYADGRVDTRGVGDRPGDPRTGFGQVQAYAKAAAVWGIMLVEYAALSPAEPTSTGAPPDDPPPPEDRDAADDAESAESADQPAPRRRDADVPDHTPEPLAPRTDTTFQSVAATVAVVDMADGEAFDGIHSLDLVTSPDPAKHTGPHSGTHTGSDTEPDVDTETGTAVGDLAFGTVLPDEPSTVGPVFGAGFPLVAGELGEPGDPGVPVDLPVNPVETFGTGTGVVPVAGEALPAVGDEVVDAGADAEPHPADDVGEDDADDYADLGDHVPALSAHDAHADHAATDEAHHADGPDPGQDTHAAAASGGESFT